VRGLPRRRVWNQRPLRWCALQTRRARTGADHRDQLAGRGADRLAEERRGGAGTDRRFGNLIWSAAASRRVERK